jgi:hypothetical protein
MTGEELHFCGEFGRGHELWLVGTTTLFVIPAVPDSAPDAIKEAIMRRRSAAFAGACECGSPVERVTRLGTERVEAMVVHHADNCPASDASLAALCREFGWPAAVA